MPDLPYNTIMVSGIPLGMKVFTFETFIFLIQQLIFSRFLVMDPGGPGPDPSGTSSPVLQALAQAQTRT